MTSMSTLSTMGLVNGMGRKSIFIVNAYWYTIFYGILPVLLIVSKMTFDSVSFLNTVLLFCHCSLSCF